MTGQSLAMAKNVLGVDPYTNEGCAAILLLAFLTDSYHIPELPSSIIVKKVIPAITAELSDVAKPDDAPPLLILLDKAFALTPDGVAINMMDLSEVDPTQLGAVVESPITSDVINIRAIIERVIVPSLAVREVQAAVAAQ